MRPITPSQLKIIHVLLNDLGIMDRKPELVYSFTDGRTDSSRKMYLSEAKTLIEYLKGRNEYTDILNRIWHLAYEMEMIREGDKSEKAMNAATLNDFCLKRGTVKKLLKDQSLKELKKTVLQFEAMHRKHKLKKSNLEYLDALKQALLLSIEEEDYERSAVLKKEIDKVNEEFNTKRKRAVKTA